MSKETIIKKLKEGIEKHPEGFRFLYNDFIIFYRKKNQFEITIQVYPEKSSLGYETDFNNMDNPLTETHIVNFIATTMRILNKEIKK